MAGKSDGSVLLDTRFDTSGMSKGISNMESRFSGLVSAAKKVALAIAAAFSIREIVAFTRECIELGSNLDEVQNVVDVTFGKMSQAVNQFSENAVDKFGLSELAAKQYTSSLGAMLKSTGVQGLGATTEQITSQMSDNMKKNFEATGDTVTDMSIALTQLSADLASFYNLSNDEAYSKIRSGLVGITMPLRSLGINMSEVNLEQFRVNQGMTTAYSKMNEQQKMLLRYNYLLSVTKDAQGDFARTAGSWANQMRVLNLQFQSIKANLGKGFINLFTPIIKVINTLLAGLAKLASAFRAFTELITGKKSESGAGVSPVEMDATADAYEDAADGASKLADSTKDTAKATKQASKETERYLSGLDQIHRYETTKDDTTSTPTSKTGTGSSASPAAALSNVDFGSLAKGETVLDETAVKMKNLFDMIKNGVQPTIDSLKRLWNEGLAQLGHFSWMSLKGFYDYFLVPIGRWTFGTGIPRFIDALNNGLMQVDWTTIYIGLNKVWRSLEPFAENVGEGLLWFWEHVLIPLGTWTMNEVVPKFLEMVKNGIDAANAIIEVGKPGFEWFWNDFLIPIGEWAGDKFIEAMDWINGKLQKFSEWCRENPQIVENMTTLVTAFFTALAGIGVIVRIWGLIKAVGAIVGAFNPVIGVIALAVAAGVMLYKNWDTIKAKAKEIWERIAGHVIDNVRKFKEDAGKMVEKLKNFIRSAWTNIKNTAVTTWTTISEKVTGFVETIRAGVSQKITTLKNTLHTIWTTIKSTAVSAWEFLTVTIPTKAQELRNSVAEWIKRLKDSLGRKWDLIKDKATTIWETIKTNTIDKVKNMWTRITKFAESIKTHFVDAFNGIKAGIKAPINAIIGFINAMIDGVVDGMNWVIRSLNRISFTLPDWMGGMHFGLDIQTIDATNWHIPPLAKGAVIPPNAPFLAQLGDQKRGTNIEAPLDTIRQAVAEAGGGNKPIHIQMYLDGRVVYETIVNQAKRQQQMTGRPPFEFA